MIRRRGGCPVVPPPTLAGARHGATRRREVDARAPSRHVRRVLGREGAPGRVPRVPRDPRRPRASRRGGQTWRPRVPPPPQDARTPERNLPRQHPPRCSLRERARRAPRERYREMCSERSRRPTPRRPRRRLRGGVPFILLNHHLLLPIRLIAGRRRRARRVSLSPRRARRGRGATGSRADEPGPHLPPPSSSTLVRADGYAYVAEDPAETVPADAPREARTAKRAKRDARKERKEKKRKEERKERKRAKRPRRARE